MNLLMNDALKRAWRTVIQAAVSSAATAALTAIGSAKTLGEVQWWTVLSTAAMAAIVSILMSIVTGLPETKEREKIMALEAKLENPKEDKEDEKDSSR